jgi:hypothetical protein
MPITVESTEAIVRDPEELREFLGSYELRNVEVKVEQVDDQWLLWMDFSTPEQEFPRLPAAIPRDMLSTTQDGDEEDVWVEPDGGFYQFLTDLAEYLETPLLIVVVGSRWGQQFALAFSVQPGAEDVVEVLMVDAR